MNDVLYLLHSLSKEAQDSTGSHGFEHTERVINMCKFLGEVLGADLDVLVPAAILHDISRNDDDHARLGAIKSRKILEGCAFKPNKIDAICQAIETHSFSGDTNAKSLEAKILSDADKLDALGAIGIYRAALYSGEKSRSFNDFLLHFDEKLLKLKNMMYTREGRKIAEKRHRYMKNYLKRLRDEVELKDF